MSMRFKGGIMSATAPTPVQSLYPVQPGAWSLQNQGQAVVAKTWPYGNDIAGFFSGQTSQSINDNNMYSSFTDAGGFTYVGSKSVVSGATYPSIIKFGPAGNVIMIIRIGTGAAGTPAVLVDSQGNIYAFYDSTRFVKYNASGTALFSKTFAANSSFEWYALTIDSSDNIYAAIKTRVSTRYVYEIGKFDTSMNVTWKSVLYSSFGSGSDANSVYQGIAVDSSGNVYSAAADISGSTRYGVLYKLNSSGVFQSAIRLNNESFLNTVAVDGSDNVYVSGYDYTTSLGFVAMYNSSLVQQWCKDFGFGSGVYNFIRNPQNTTSIIGMVPLVTGSSSNNYVDRSVVFSVDSTGAIVWANSISSPNKSSATGSSQGIIYAAAYKNNIGLSANATVFPVIVSANSGGGNPITASIGILPFNGKGASTTTVYMNSDPRLIVYATTSTTSANFTAASTSVTLSTVGSGTLTSTATSITGSLITAAYTASLWANSAPAYGSSIYATPGTYTWICPTGVTSVSVLCVGPGGGTQTSASGAGGGLGYKNNYSVTAGSSYTVVVGQQNTSDSYFVNTTTVRGARGGATTGGTYVGDGGGAGGNTSNNGGGGAGGYTAAGGASTTNTGTASTGGGGGGGGLYDSGGGAPGNGGGGVGIYGLGSNGSTYGGGGSRGSNGTAGSQTYDSCSGTYSGNAGRGGTFGGGAGGYNSGAGSFTAGWGGGGVVRIVWPGATRQFPSTNVSTN